MLNHCLWDLTSFIVRWRSQMPSYHSYREKRNDRSNTWDLAPNQWLFQHIQGAVKMTQYQLWKGSMPFKRGFGCFTSQCRRDNNRGHRSSPTRSREREQSSAGQNTWQSHLRGLLFPMKSPRPSTQRMRSRVKNSEMRNPANLGPSIPGLTSISASGPWRGLEWEAQGFQHLQTYIKYRNFHPEPAARMNESVFKYEKMTVVLQTKMKVIQMEQHALGFEPLWHWRDFHFLHTLCNLNLVCENLLWFIIV